MTPFKLAWTIAQFAFWLVLFFGIIPAALYYSGVFAVAWYSEHKTEQAAKAEQAEKDKELKKTCTDWEGSHPIGSPIDISEPEGAGVADAIYIDPPEGCKGPLEEAYNAKVTRLPTVIQLVEQLRRDKDFMSASRSDQVKYLADLYPAFKAASAERQADFLAYVTQKHLKKPRAKEDIFDQAAKEYEAQHSTVPQR